jgi:hypothetical protein
VGRRGLALVIAALGGCAVDLPRDLRIETGFTAEEGDAIAAAVHEANQRLGEPLLAGPVLILRGSFTDPDGFQLADFDDGVGVVYTVDVAAPAYRYLAAQAGAELAGYATLGDVLLFEHIPPGASDDQRRRFRRIAMHELGHYLGMSHNPDQRSIMYSGNDRLDLDTYTVEDQRAFCAIYDCVVAP